MIYRLPFLFRPLCTLVLTAAATCACVAQGITPQDTVASYRGEHVITLAQLEQYVRDYPYGIMYRDRPLEGYTRALDDMITNQLKRQEFFALGLADSFASRGTMTRSINEELVISYYQRKYAERYVNEASLQREYKRMGSVVAYREIRIAVPPGGSRSRVEALTTLAGRIEKRWRAGEDPAVFIPRIASGASVTVNNAEQTVTWSISMMDENNAVIYDLTPGACRVLHDPQGIRIVKVMARTMEQIPSFEDAHAELLKGMEEKYGGISQHEFEQDKAALINEARVTWNRRALARIVRWSNIPGFYKYGYSDTLRSASAQGRNEWILRAPGLRIDFKEYLRLLNDVLAMGDFVSIGPDDVKGYILEAVRTSMLIEKAKVAGLEKNVYTSDTKNPVISHGILQLYNQHEIEGKIPPLTDEALRVFYATHKDSLYYQLAKVNLYVIPDSTPGPLEAKRSRLATGTLFENLAPTILVKTYVRTRNGTYRTHLGNEPPFLAAVAFSLSLHEIAGPVQYDDPSSGRMYALVKCAGLQTERQLAYEDVGHRIREDYLEHQKARREAELRAYLKRKYAVVVHDQMIERYIEGRKTAGQ